MTKVLAILSVTPDYEQFGIPELKTIMRKTNIPFNILFKHEIQQFPKHDYDINYKSFKNFPFIMLNIPDFQHHKHYLTTALHNGVMVTKLIQIIGYDQTYQKMFETYNQETVKKQLNNWDAKVYCQFFSRNRSIGRQEHRAKINDCLQKMKTCGKVDLQNPDIILCLAQDHKWFLNHHELQSKQTLKNVYFGIQLSSNRGLKGGAKFNQKYELSNRIYLGPTTTDNDLSFLMCHQAVIDQSSFVLDPFAGTGSLLVPPSHYGAFVFGSDLDIRVLNGYAVGKINKKSTYYCKQKQYQIFTPKIMLNFNQYELKQPEIFRMDCLKGRFRCKQMFDAIICDPPYGIRAMSRKILNKKKQEQSNSLEQKQQKQQIKEQKQQVKETKPLQVIENKQDLAFQQKTKEYENKQDSSQEQLTNQLEEKDEKQISRRKQKRKLRKQMKKQRNQALTVQEKQFKQQIMNKFTQQVQKKWTYKPNIQCTSKDQIYNGLLSFADEFLKPKGYLVFLYPILAEENFQGTGQQLPQHLNFELIDFSTHKMKEGNVRVLITMRKLQKQKQ